MQRRTSGRTGPPADRRRARACVAPAHCRRDPEPPRVPADALPSLTFHEVNVERWPDLVRLFEARGGPSHCWCMVWRGMPAGAARRARSGKRAALETRVAAAVPIGILGYDGVEPVAWCSIAPRETYRPLGGPHGPDDGTGAVWSLVCFFVPRRLRGRGITPQLITRRDCTGTHARRTRGRGLPGGSRLTELPLRRFRRDLRRRRLRGGRPGGVASPRHALRRAERVTEACGRGRPRRAYARAPATPATPAFARRSATRRCAASAVVMPSPRARSRMASVVSYTRSASAAARAGS